MPDDSVMRLVYLLLLGLALAGWVLVEFRRNFGRAAKMALAWGMIFLGVIALYGLWGDIRAGLHPGQSATAQSVTLPRAQDGHYYARLRINGVPVEFMVDTGASQVVLSPADAGRLGFAPESLVYTGQAQTANGTVRTARVTLPDVRFGPFTQENLPASVNEAPMEISLLGMDFLDRFQITIAGDRMELRR